MTLKAVKNRFLENLIPIYGAEEAYTLFKWCANNYLHLNAAELILKESENVAAADKILLDKALNRLTNEEPIQYIIGHTEFYGLPFEINPNVLIPRPETEELVAWVIESVQEIQNPRIIDIGTGSGCIAIALAKNLPAAKVSALDISKAALNIAASNAKANEVQIRLIQDDVLTLETLPDTYDIVVSNPPYVRMLEKKEMKPNVLHHEPELALFVPDDNPLLFYQKITALAQNNLDPNGQLFFEINQYLGRETCNLVAQNNFVNLELRKDLTGNDRMLRAVVKE